MTDLKPNEPLILTRVCPLRLLGGDDNHVVGTTHTEDGERRRVFQYLHGFRCSVIQEVDVVVEQSVHHIEWLVAADGVCSAYTDFRVGACRRSLSPHAGNLSLQCGYGLTTGLLAISSPLMLVMEPVQVLVLALPTDDNGFGQHLRVVFHLDVDYRAGCPRLTACFTMPHSLKNPQGPGWPGWVPAVYAR